MNLLYFTFLHCILVCYFANDIAATQAWPGVIAIGKE